MIKRDGRVEEEQFVAQVSVLNGIRVVKLKEYIATYVAGGFVRREGKCLVWQGRQQKPNILSVSQTT